MLNVLGKHGRMVTHLQAGGEGRGGAGWEGIKCYIAKLEYMCSYCFVSVL